MRPNIVPCPGTVVDSVTGKGLSKVELLLEPSRVGGVVFDNDGRPAMSATVAMVPPESLRHREDLYRTATSDRSGLFALDPAAPREYKLFAWEDAKEHQWRDPDFLKEHEGRGERVILTVNERKSVRLQEIRVLP